MKLPKSDKRDHKKGVSRREVFKTGKYMLLERFPQILAFPKRTAAERRPKI